MKKTKLFALLAASCMLLAGCGLKQDAVIKVNDRFITKNQINKEISIQANNGMLKSMGINLKENPNGFLALMIKERSVNELIIKTLWDEEIEKRGIKVSKEDVDNAVKDIIDKVGSKEQLDTVLKQNGVSAAQFRKDLEEEVKMKKLAKELGNSSVSDAEAKSFYNSNISKFKYPEKVRASHILVMANPVEIREIIISDSKNKNLSEAQIQAKVNEELAARKAKAEALYNQAKVNPDGFAKLAQENSDDTATAVKGGDLGFFAKEEMVPEFSKAAFAQRPNTVSPVIKSNYGYHIILVTDRMEAGQQPFEKAKVDIKNYLENQKQLELLDKLTESLKKNAKIEFLDDNYNPKVINEKLQEALKKETEAVKK